MKLRKESANKKLTDGNDCYSLEGAEYTLYYGTTGSISGASVFSGVTAVTPGTCSTIPPVDDKEATCDGFTLADGAVVCVTTQWMWYSDATLDVNGTGAYPVYYNGSAYDDGAYGISDGDSVYLRFDGAHWNIVEASDISGSVCRTDENGYFMSGNLPVASGCYFLKETKASKGYELDTSYYRIKVTDMAGTDNVTYTVEKISGTASGKTLYQNTTREAAPVTFDLTTEEARSYEPPASDPFLLTLRKGDAETGEMIPRGEVLKLAGAIFELTYYDNTDGDTSGETTRTWYFETKDVLDADGNPTGEAKLDCNDESYWVRGPKVLYKGTENEIVIASDDLYKDSDGKVIYPVGTYVIKEIVAPPSFTLNGNMHLEDGTTFKSVTDGLKFILKRSDEYDEDNDEYGVLIYQGDTVTDKNLIDATNIATEAYDNPHRDGTQIKVVKKGDNGKLLKGVEYKLEGDNGDVYTATTDDNGEAVFEDLLPQYYTLTEIKTVNGTTLMSDSIRIRLPYSVMPEEVDDQHIDTSGAEYDEVTDTWCFYKLTYTITNHVVFDVPRAGVDASAMIWMPFVCGLAALGYAMTIALKRKCKSNL